MTTPHEPSTLRQRVQQLSLAMEMLDSIMRKPYSDADLAAVMLTLIDVRDALRAHAEPGEGAGPRSDAEIDDLIALGYEQYHASDDAAGRAHARAVFRDALRAAPREAEPSPSTPLDRIADVMREPGLADDLRLSEIQDYLTMAGYDVPLRSYVSPSTPAGRPEPSEAAYDAAVKAFGECHDGDRDLGVCVARAVAAAYAIDFPAALREDDAPRPPDGPWRIVQGRAVWHPKPGEDAFDWYVTRPGFLGSRMGPLKEAEAIAVRDVLNRVARAREDDAGGEGETGVEDVAFLLNQWYGDGRAWKNGEANLSVEEQEEWRRSARRLLAAAMR